MSTEDQLDAVFRRLRRNVPATLRPKIIAAVSSDGEALTASLDRALLLSLIMLSLMIFVAALVAVTTFAQLDVEGSSPLDSLESRLAELEDLSSPSQMPELPENAPTPARKK